MTEYKRVSDIAPLQSPLDGEKRNVRDLVGLEFVVTRIEEREGENGEYLAVQCELDGNLFFFFSNHQAIMPKLRKCIDAVPLLATIVESKSKSTGRGYFDIG